MAGNNSTNSSNELIYKTNDMQTEGEVIERPEHHSTFQHLPIPHETQLHLQLSEAYLDIKDSLTFHVTREWEMGFGYNLMPVVLGLGIAVYFWAPAEPSLFALVLTPIIGMLVLRKLGQFGNWYYVFLGLVVFFCGMLAAKIAVLNSVTPVIEKRMIAEVSGIVLNVDQNRRGASRYLIRPQAVS
ncbi:MAG: hypothetical protein AAGF54_18710, partial [Pseudomonadota bacterium]